VLLARTDERFGLAGGDSRASDAFGSFVVSGWSGIRSPKNRGPFHLVPVISWAMTERLR
jgi:hypothetical protein